MGRISAPEVLPITVEWIRYDHRIPFLRGSAQPQDGRAGGRRFPDASAFNARRSSKPRPRKGILRLLLVMSAFLVATSGPVPTRTTFVVPLCPARSGAVTGFAMTAQPEPPQVSLPESARAATEPIDATQPAPTGPDPPFELPHEFPNPPPLSTLSHAMPFKRPSAMRRFGSSWRMLRQIRGRLSKRTVLTARIGGPMSEGDGQPSLPFSGPPDLTLPVLLNALRVGAHDPRIAHLHLRIDALACGWAKVFEMRRHLEYFRASGKGITVFMETGGPKEYFLGMGFALYVPPEGGLGLRGFAASGSFLGGVLEKIGVAPQVERIGKYKSAGDQLARKDMSSAQREVINSLLGETHKTWTRSVCEAIGISEGDLAAFVDRSPWDMNEYVEAGLITGICYESDIEDRLKVRFAKGNEKEEDLVKKPLTSVEVRRYTRRNTEKLVGIGGKKKIAVIRAVGAITSGKNSSSPVTGNTLGSESLVELIRKVRDDKRYVACLLRCDSPGGSALASDIMWSELKKLAAIKPVLASQSDVAASGGYYISMACDIIAEPLTITGSVGVVTVKPSLGELYKKIGYTKENISIGSKYAELLVDNRPFTEEEDEYYRDGAFQAYRKFVSKAAKSRGKTYEEMHAVAQGRVWTGSQAKQQGMVDHLGGIGRAVEILKEKAEVGADEYVKLEVMRNPTSLAARLGLKSASTEAAQRGQVMASLREPLALAEIDASLGGVSPLTRFFVDATLAPLSRNFGFLTKSGHTLEMVLQALFRSE